MREKRTKTVTRQKRGPKSLQTQQRWIREFLESLDSPRALTVWLLYRYGEHAQLVNLAIDPMSYSDAEAFRIDYQATKLLSKCADLRTGIDTKEVALAQARRAESQCAISNALIRLHRLHPVRGGPGDAWCVARTIIERILGACPTDINQLDPSGWSPGRTSSCSGTEISGVHKYVGRLDVTPSAYGVVRNYVNAAPTWAAAAINAAAGCSLTRAAFTFVEGNNLTVVPKNAKTDRTICYEPHANITVQLVLGRYLRSRLARAGVNLSDQSINQRRAQLASRTGHLATIDLSSASDTVSIEIVRELLPDEWFSLLNKVRSHRTTWPDGVTRQNHKFSSMGNGFTFELESLIFYALASAVSPNVSVYGDDIIVPTSSAQAVLEVLALSGFTANQSKTFTDGLFRESCGTDAFSGLLCTPVYVRRLSGDDWFRLFHNSVRSWAAVLPERRYAFLLRSWRDAVPDFVGCSSKGDGHYHVNWDESAAVKAQYSVEGWYFKSWTRMARVSHLYGDRLHGCFSGNFAFGALAVALGPKPSRSVVDVTVDKRLYRYKASRILSHQWENIMWL